MLLDTNILIAYLDDESLIVNALDTWRAQGTQLVISSITIAELLSYTKLAAFEIEIIEQLTRTFVSVPLNDEHAKAAAALRRKYSFDIPDSVIIAAAQIRGIPLVTRDIRLHKVTEVTFVHI